LSKNDQSYLETENVLRPRDPFHFISEPLPSRLWSGETHASSWPPTPPLALRAAWDFSASAKPNKYVPTSRFDRWPSSNDVNQLSLLVD
jgi:hypothetical protein